LLGQNKSVYVVLRQVISDYVRLVHVMLGEFMLCWGRSGYDRLVLGNSGYVRICHVKSG